MNKIDYKIWGKFDRATKKTHPALFHMLDSGFIAKEILLRILPDEELEYMANSLGLTKDEAIQFVVGIVPYHDIGKITPNFAIQSEAYKPLQDDGYNFFGLDGKNKPHFRHEVFSKQIMNGKLPDTLCSLLGGHHGRYSVLPKPRKQDGRFFFKCLKDDKWKEQQELAIDVIQKVFPIPSKIWKKAKLPQHFYFFFSGLLSLSDWIASDENFFPFAGEETTWQEYVKDLPQKAKFALDNIKMDLCPIKDLSFEEMFPNITPYESQKTIIEIADKLKEPSLLIVEMSTGQGKTEVGFYASDKLMTNVGHRGMHILMPTQATTNAMVDRTVNYLENITDGEANFQIGHGNANAHEWYKKIDTKDTVSPFEWFNSGKRKFFSQFGDSTIDQALFGVVPVKYFFLRLYGLVNKVVIFDEIHAYDTYMQVLIKRLLKELKNLRCSVIMLSATLTKQMKKEFVEAYGGELKEDVPYPRVCVVSGNKTIVKKLPPEKTKTIKLDHFYINPNFKIKNGIVVQQYYELLGHVLKKIKNGGCLAIVCNTVKQAQRINKLLAKMVPDIHRKLIHARFRDEDKDKLTQEVLSDYGKDGTKRPFISILVGTQIIEQSLNVDFDYMLTFLCPIDLLLQRGGRNHRFIINRPLGLRSPRIGVVYEFDEDGVLENYVYDSYTMQRTYDILHNKTQLKIPDMVEELIEYVYKPFEKLTKKEQETYNKAHDKLEKKEVKEENLANSIVLKEDNDLNINPSKKQEKENKLSTRNIVSAMKVVILFYKQGDKRWYLDPKRKILAPDLTKIPNKKEIELLQKSQCPIIGNPYFNYFQKTIREEWERTPLRYCGLLILDENNYLKRANFEAKYDLENGLQLKRLKKY